MNEIIWLILFPSTKVFRSFDWYENLASKRIKTPKTFYYPISQQILRFFLFQKIDGKTEVSKKVLKTISKAG